MQVRARFFASADCPALRGSRLLSRSLLLFVPLVVFVLLVGTSLNGMAGEHLEERYRQDFKAGIAAFRNNNLEEARQRLESAATGLESRALTYNLGVLYYRLREFDLAEQQFRKLLDTAQRALAFYNLGLIALAREDQTAAREAFHSAASETTEENLSRLARAKLRELKAPLPARDWQALVSIAAGYENNIGLFPDSAPSAIDGSFTETIAALSGTPLEEGKDALKTTLQLYGRDYMGNDRFNAHLVRGLAAWQRTLEGGRLELGLGADQVWLGNRSREQRARLAGKWTTRGCALGSESALCSLALNAEQVFAAPRYNAYDGQHYQAEARYRARQGKWLGQAQYRLEYDDRENFNTGREFFSVSPIAHTLKLGLDYALTPSFDLGASVGYRFSHYRSAHRLLVPEGLLSIQRQDNRVQMALEGDYQATERVSVLLKLQSTDNNSNIARYDYNRQTATLGVAVRL